MLPQVEGFASALLEVADKSVVATVVSELVSLEETVLARPDLRAMLTDTSLLAPVRAQVFLDLLHDKVSETTLRLAVYTAASTPAQEVPHEIAELSYLARTFAQDGSITHPNLSLLNARRRVAGFADAVLDRHDTSLFAQIEEELFRWARTIEGNLELRRLLLDRDAPLASRVGTAEALLKGKVVQPAWELARFVLEGGRPRDVVGTLDYLVDYVAKVRDWRVARVHTARPLDPASQAELVASLAALTGKNVELQIAEDAALLGGVIVEVGDLRLDASIKGRLGSLRDAVSAGRVFESTLVSND